ncbi:hypothetical protein HDU93_002074 [Gonapodya sp. JEL0774]|nr:hypothetical protein HDU93_002074 [Gonapodya sp. JEL0774]
MSAETDEQLARRLWEDELSQIQAYDDHLAAKQLEEELQAERSSPSSFNTMFDPYVASRASDAEDPTPDIRELFQVFDREYFDFPGGYCSVRLSDPLLKFRPRCDLISTLLHEMIHAYLFLTNGSRDRSGHGPDFLSQASRLSALSGANITVYHTFRDEVDHYRKHIWRCEGSCRTQPPYFGFVKRSMNRPPQPADRWWNDHQSSCGGKYVKISGPDMESADGEGGTKPSAGGPGGRGGKARKRKSDSTSASETHSKTKDPSSAEDSRVVDKRKKVGPMDQWVTRSPRRGKDTQVGTTSPTVHDVDAGDSSAVIRLVDIGSKDPQFKGAFINTLIIDDTSSGVLSTPASPPRLLSELNAELDTKANSSQPFTVSESKVSITDFEDGAAPEGSSARAEVQTPLSTAAGGRLLAKYQGLNALKTGASEKSEKQTLVIAHGYGAALGFFYRNYYGLSLLNNTKIMAFDWLGMGNSSRPPFPKHNDPEKAEKWFVDSLEAWRQASGIEKMVLCGHSLGGYLSAAYAMRFPERVSKLILVSPVGVPHLPSDFKLPGWVSTLWSWNFTPQGIIRMVGPWGPDLVQRYTDRRFAFLDESDAKDMREYLYHTLALRGSGEYALGSILLPGAFAKRPLMDRIGQLKVPTTFVYGSHDWMDYRHALEAAKAMPLDRVKVVRVPEGGHHLYLDNPPVFNEVILAEMLEEQGVKVKREDLSVGVRTWRKGENEDLLGSSTRDQGRRGW